MLESQLHWVVYACRPDVFPKPEFAIDWPEFLTLIKSHKVLLLAYQNKDMLECPGEVMAQWKAMVMQQRQYQLQQKAILKDLVDTLKAAGVDAIFFKGFAAGQQLYGNPGLKVSSDIDLIVPFEQVDRAYKALSKAHYQQAYVQKKVYLSRLEKRFRSEASFYKCGVHVDLHWRMHHHRFKNQEFFRDMQCDVVSIDGIELKTLPVSVFYEYSLLHADGSVWRRLSWFLDCLRLQDKVGSVNKLSKEASRALSTFKDLKSFFQSYRRPKKLRSRLALKALHSSRPKQWLIYTYVLFFGLSLRNSFLYLFNGILTSPKDWALLPLPKPLFFLYFILRPFLCLKRKLQKA